MNQSQYEWMVRVLRLMTLDELRDLGVTVYQAPKVPKRAKVVNLMTGKITDVGAERVLAPTGQFGKYDEILALAGRFGLELVENEDRLEEAPSGAGPEPAEGESAHGR